MKVCRQCSIEKEETEFYKDRKYLSSYCKVCSNTKRKENYYKTPYNPNSKYLKEFGITLEQYNIRFEEQNGCCAICGRHQVEFKRRLAIDHNHTTGKIRGLLCSHCNLMLGQAQDNLDTLQNAIEYLKEQDGI